jgi:hypothetical protein
MKRVVRRVRKGTERRTNSSQRSFRALFSRFQYMEIKSASYTVGRPSESNFASLEEYDM